MRSRCQHGAGVGGGGGAFWWLVFWVIDGRARDHVSRSNEELCKLKLHVLEQESPLSHCIQVQDGPALSDALGGACILMMSGSTSDSLPLGAPPLRQRQPKSRKEAFLSLLFGGCCSPAAESDPDKRSSTPQGAPAGASWPLVASGSGPFANPLAARARRRSSEPPATTGPQGSAGGAQPESN